MNDQDTKDAQQFLEALFPVLDDNNRIEIRLLYPGTRDSAKRPQFFSTVADAIDYAAKYYEDCEVFFGVSARGPKAIGKKHNLTYISTLFADLDVGQHWKTKEEALAGLESFVPAPSIIIDSGGGYHAYWLLKERVTFGEWRCREKCPACQEQRRGRCPDCRICMSQKNPTHLPAEMDRVEGVMRGLIPALHLDNVFDATRILRIPGTQNNKPGRGHRPVKLVRFEPDQLYDLDAVASRFWLPRSDEDVEPPQRFFPPGVPDGTKKWAWLKKKAKHEFSEGQCRSLVSMVEKGDARRFKNSHGSPGDRSGMNESAIKKLRRLGAENNDILAIFKAYPIGEKFREAKSHGKAYLRSRIVAADKSLESGGPESHYKPPPRQIDYSYWFYKFAYFNSLKVLGALKEGPQTMRTLMAAIAASRPTVQKWLDLVTWMDWAVEAKPAKGTGGASAKVWELTEKGQDAYTRHHWVGAFIAPLQRSLSARALYLATNPPNGLKRPAAVEEEIAEAAA